MKVQTLAEARGKRFQVFEGSGRTARIVEATDNYGEARESCHDATDRGVSAHIYDCENREVVASYAPLFAGIPVSSVR